MRKIFVLALLALGLNFLLVGCDPAPTISSNMGKWELVGETPASWPTNGIYKLHSDKEKATFYASRVNGGYSISVVKD